jgi:hypothetical protein
MLPRPAAAPAPPTTTRTTVTRVDSSQRAIPDHILTLPSAASFLNDKAGFNISKDNQEKATDFARSQYEKSSG